MSGQSSTDEYWMSLTSHVNGIGSQSDGKARMISVVLDSGTHQAFSGIRLLISYREGKVSATL
jgi:hypothetical protein